MSARDDVFRGLHGTAPAPRRVANQMLDAYRAEVLREAADFVRDAHFRDGLSVQEIGTALRFMADTNTTQGT
jgi:hypothetical protein